jgi:hypothetical protein
MDPLTATSRTAFGGCASISSSDALIDPSAPLVISLDPSYRALTPAHWVYTILGAVRMGDVPLTRSTLSEPSRSFTIDLLSEPLGPLRQTLLHVAALMNQGQVLCEFLAYADAQARATCEAEKLSLRKESLKKRASESDPVAYQTTLGRNLDQIERVSGPAQGGGGGREGGRGQCGR